MKRWVGFDRVILGYAAVLSVMVVAGRPPGWGLYLGAHGLVLGLIALIIGLHARHGGRFLTFLRYWYIIPVVMASFRELHYLVPAIHPFDDLRYDHQLATLDERWFGNVDGFFLSMATPGLIDILHLCYWSYFGLLMVPGAVLFAKGKFDRLRHYSTTLLTALYLSYLAYFIFPSVGPHLLYTERPVELDGWLVGGFLHSALMAIEMQTADAFPSGHTLATTVALVMAWRLHRPTFRYILAPGIGIIVATMALRYHYVVDVLAGAALVPVVIFLGTALFQSAEELPRPSLSSET